jgi:hypothetical protein
MGVFTVNEVIERNKDHYDFIEIFVGDRFHTDYCDSYNPEQGYGDCKKGQEERLNHYCLDYKVKDFELMTCEDFDNAILCNTGCNTESYGYDGNEKFLCILIDRKEIAKGEELGL